MTWTTALNGTSKLGRVVSLLMAGGGRCNYLVRCLPSAWLHEERVRVCRRKCYRCQLGEELKTMNLKKSAVWTTLKSRLCWPQIRSPRHIHHLQLSKFWVWLRNHCDKYQWKTKSRVWYLEVWRWNIHSVNTCLSTSWNWNWRVSALSKFMFLQILVGSRGAAGPKVPQSATDNIAWKRSWILEVSLLKKVVLVKHKLYE